VNITKSTGRLLISLLISITILIFSQNVHSVENNLVRSEYEATIEKIKKRQNEFKTKFLTAENMEEKDLIIKEARSFLFGVLTQRIFPAWYGTPWSFNGHTRIPGDDSIACGTFVVYSLQDAGFEIPSKMAMQPSENIIKNLTGSSEIKRFWNSAEMEKIHKWIQQKGEGIYIVGLDIHVGFIINQNDNITFCHSSYYDPPRKVVNQDMMEKSPLTDSRYRIIGKIFDDQMIEKWIIGEVFPLTYDYFDH
jgi:hypothetical protein